MPEKNNISIKEFKSSDLSVVKRLIHNTIDTCYSEIYPKEAVQFFKDWHSDDRILNDAKQGHTLVIEKDGRIIGTGTIVGDEIKRVFVRPRFQKQGFGRVIMGKLEEKAISLGIRGIKLDASLPSKNFYDLLGYATLEETFLEVENNKKLHYYKMQKTLI